jgi:pilus assembly protein TadC
MPFKNALGKYKSRKRTREMEEALPAALYQMASLSSFSPIEEAVRSVAESRHGALSEEFAAACNEMRTGSSFENAIGGVVSRNDSWLLRRALETILVGYETGADTAELLKSTAEDIEKTHDLHRQRAAAMAVEKYTLLLAGAVIVPLVLGIMISLVSGMSLNFPSELSGADEGVRKLVLSNAVLGNQLYIAVYSVMASFFIALQENKKEKAAVYAAVLLPVSLLVFSAARSISLL